MLLFPTETAFLHRLRLPRELYYDDYRVIRKKRFKIKRSSLEDQVKIKYTGTKYGKQFFLFFSQFFSRSDIRNKIFFF